ncbi:MAG: hypothetical protein OXM87_04550 [Truepera sp.]|nr:hypothetical protein [Truepera sp.]
MVYYAAIALVSAASLLLELALLRLFAVQQFYHFAFMAVSLALLGAGASGSLLSLWPRPLRPAWSSLGFSVSILGAYLLINALPFDSFSVAWDRRQPFFLALYFLAAAVPFLFSGLLIGGALMAAGREGRSHRIYGANLIGSGLGCAFSLAALDGLGGVGALLVATLLGLVAGLGFEASVGRRVPVLVTALVLATLVTSGLLVWRPSVLAQRLSPYKALPVLLRAPDAVHTFSDADATIRVDVVETQTVHVFPGLSLLSPLGPPPQAALLIDGDGLMPITALPPVAPEAAQLADAVPSGLAYRLRPGARTLVLQPGTGLEVLMALAAGAEYVTAVDDRRLVLEVVRDRYDTFTGGLYHHPRLELALRSGRVFARRGEAGRYGLVVVALSDPHRPVMSGAYGLTESYSYTVEAFRDYLQLLEPGGLLLASRWLQTPPSEGVRLFATLAEALSASGREPTEHLLAFRTLRTLTVVAAERPFEPEEIDILRSFLEERAYDAVMFPGITEADLNRFQVLPEASYHAQLDAVLRDPSAAYTAARFDIRPVRDDRPFFYHYFRWAQTPEVLANLGRTWQPFGGSGFLVLVALLILVVLASATFILGPLLLAGLARGVRERTEPPRLLRARAFLYFSCLGLAFLLVEIPLAQRFILVLGHPVTALAAVLFAVLVFSGLGSLVARWLPARTALLLLVVLIVVAPVAIRALSPAALALPEGPRWVLAMLALAPLGFLMGIPFPAGLARLEQTAPTLVPWVWAVNGCFSVVSAVLAVMLAITWGFTVVLWLGAGAYALAYLALPRRDLNGYRV